MKNAFLFGSIFALSSVFIFQVSAVSIQGTPSPDSKSSTSPLNAPSLTDPDAQPVKPPAPPPPPPAPKPLLKVENHE